MNISLAAEPIFSISGLTITNSAFTAVLVSFALIIIAAVLRVGLLTIPKRAQTLAEMIYDGLLGITKNVIGREDVAQELFPFIITAFFFIVISNWSGLIPGFSSILHGETPVFRAPTSDLNTVIALALCSVAYVQYLGFKYRGIKGYLSTFFNFSGPIYFAVGIIELISEIMRPISYSFRLFGNVFAGEVLLAVIIFLNSTFLPFTPIIPLPFYALELFVGVIQALVFCFLTIVFASIAISDHGEPHAEVPLEAVAVQTSK